MPGFELFGDAERKEVNDVLQTGILMRYGFDGPRKGVWKAREMEAEICKVFGCHHAQLVSSGTAALTTALAALGVGAGDEVIMPVFTFVASFEAVLSVGAIPVLAEIDETLTLDPESVRKSITPKTKCVMPVHMCGGMADLQALMTICREHNLLLLEDACQSIGATYRGKYLGTMGHAGTLSFDFVKTVTCGEGGAVLTNDRQTYIHADGFSDHGHDHKGNDRGLEPHPFLGYNFRISELHAAVGLAQFRRLGEFLSIQRKHHARLKTILSAVPEIGFRPLPDPAGDSCTFLCWYLPTEALMRALVAELKEQGALAGNFYWYEHNWHYIRKWDHLRKAVSLYKLTEPQEKAIRALAHTSFSISDGIMGRGISTAIGLTWTEAQVEEKGEKIVAAVKKVLARSLVK